MAEPVGASLWGLAAAVAVQSAVPAGAVATPGGAPLRGVRKSADNNYRCVIVAAVVAVAVAPNASRTRRVTV